MSKKKINKFDKALKPKKEKAPPKRIYKYKNYQTPYLIFYPLMVLLVMYDSWTYKRYEALEWSEEKAVKIIDKYLIKASSIDAESQEISYCSNWYAGSWRRAARPWDRNWCGKFHYEIVRYLTEEYTIDGYEKRTARDYQDSWVIFKKINKEG